MLLVMMAGHAIRETARDALFLSGLPAERLPWAYLAIALLTLGVGVLGRELPAGFSRRAMLSATLVFAACVDLVFWGISSLGFPGTLFALYVWTGLLATTLTMQFWLYLTSAFDVGEAKRSFGPIAAGGLLGAVIGSGVAGLVASVFPTHALLLASAALFAAAAWLPPFLPPPREPAAAARPAPDTAPPASVGWRELLASPYLRRVLALVALTAVLGTGIDFAFKSRVAAEIPRAQLAGFFATFNAGTNLAALAFQVLLAPLLLQTLGVVRALAVLPAALCVGAGAVAFAGGLAPLVLLRGTDATLRHSVQRTGTEILTLPLEGPLRNVFRAVIESLGQRGGQALASVAILLAVALHVEERELGFAFLGLSALALLSLVGLRQHYVTRFREQLRNLSPETRRSVPRLELHSLEVLVSSLSSPNDAEVLSALDLLEAYGKAPLIPPLILHHPSRAVVLRALALLSGSSHPHLDAGIERLLAHADAEVRASALQAYAARAPGGPEILRLLHTDPSLSVRATAVVAWMRSRGNAREVESLMDAFLREGGREVRIAVARALPSLPYAWIAEGAQRLIADGDPTPAAELAQAAQSDPRPEQIPLLIALLARRPARPYARAALRALGAAAFEALCAAQRSAETPPAVRHQLPRTISRFATPRAAGLLVEAATSEDPRVGFRALRGLGRLRAQDPSLPVDLEPLLRVGQEWLERAVTMLYYRVAHAAWSRVHPAVGDASAELLDQMLAEVEHHALERVFRVLHIRDPEQEYAVIFEALRRGDPYRAGSREILEHLVEGPWRDGLLALLDAGDAEERLRSAMTFFVPEGAKQLLDLLRRPDPPAATTDEDAIAALAGEALAGAARDRDPILASVVRRRMRSRTVRRERR